MNTRSSLKLTTFIALLLGSQMCLSEVEREGQWLHYLQQGQAEGMDMPHALTSNEEVISLSQADLARLLGSAQQASTDKRSKLQFTKLNYQADISEKSLQLRMFYQF